MSLPIRILNLSSSIFRKKTFTGPGTNYNSFINSSFINNSVSTLNFVTNNTFFKSLHKFICIVLISKIKPATGKKKLIYLSLQIFQAPKKWTIDRNINFHRITLASNYSLSKKKQCTTNGYCDKYIYKYILYSP